MSSTVHLLMLYVQHAVSEGLQPDETGVYSIARKEFIASLGIPASTFDQNRAAFVNEMMTGWDLEIMFSLKGLLHENLYTDVKYEKGSLTFKRNPITMRPELSYVWGIKPPYWERRMFVDPYIPVPDSVKLPISM